MNDSIPYNLRLPSEDRTIIFRRIKVFGLIVLGNAILFTLLILSALLKITPANIWSIIVFITFPLIAIVPFVYYLRKKPITRLGPLIFIPSTYLGRIKLLKYTDLSRAYLIGANLSRADLSGAYLSRADLRGADLNKTKLRGADLRGADLREADLSGAYLSGAKLNKTKLSRANLSRADLSGAYLSRADLRGAELVGVNLTGADLTGAKAYNNQHQAFIRANVSKEMLTYMEWVENT